MNTKTKSIFRFLAISFFTVVLVMATSQFVGLAASKGMLLWAAPFLPAFPILGLIWLRTREELLGWALFTVWLGSTYAGAGTPPELAVFGLIVLLAVGGVILSPWLFVVAWFGHIVWDFMPRELPELLLDLPIACMIFDGLIGLYLVYRICYSSKRLTNYSKGINQAMP